MYKGSLKRAYLSTNPDSWFISSDFMRMDCLSAAQSNGNKDSANLSVNNRKKAQKVLSLIN